MTDDPFSDEGMKRIAIEFLGITPDKYDEATSALCKRLGISRASPELGTWMFIGLALAREQPEFKPRRGPGRRALKETEGGVDYKRAMAVKRLKREKEVGGDKRPYTDKDLINELSVSDHSLFLRNMMLDDSLVQSVSRGNRRWNEALAEVKRLKGKLNRAENRARKLEKEAGMTKSEGHGRKR